MRIFLISFSFVVGVATLFIHLYQIPEVDNDLALMPEASRSQTHVVASQVAKQNTSKQKHKSTGPKSPADQLIVPMVLQGTDIHGSLAVDAQGDLLITPKTRQVFDYFLQLSGTEAYTLEQLQQLTAQYMQAVLSEPALSQALELLERYVGFYRDRDNAELIKGIAEKKTRFDGMYSAQQLSVVQRYYDELNKLKQQYFSEQERQAFFAEEEQYTSYMLSRMEIAHAPYSEQEKRYLLDDLQHNTSSSFILQRRETFVLETIKQQDIHDPAAYEVIAQQFGDDRAEKLRLIEEDRRAWREKKRQYRELRAKIEKEHQYYSKQQLDLLLEDYMLVDLNFSSADMQRIKSLEGRL